MKQVVLTLAALLCCMSLWAANSPIKLKPKNKYEDKRELVPEMTMQQMSDNILILSSDGLYEATVTVNDETGNIVCTEMFVVHPEQPYTLTLPSLDTGIYEVEVIIGDVGLYGEFSVE